MKKSAKISLISIVSIVVIVGLVIGLYFGVFKNIGKREAIAKVEEMFQEVKNVDANTIQEYISQNETEDEEASDVFENEELIKAMFKYLNYEVLGAEESGDAYAVKVVVSNKSFKEVFTNYVTEAIRLAFQKAFSSMTEDELNTKMEEYFIAQYDSESITIVTKEIDVVVAKVDGELTVQKSDAIIEAILPGYAEVMESVEQMNNSALGE